MPGIGIKLPAVGDLHNIPQVHHCHPMADMLYHCQVMGNKQIGQAQLFLQLFQEVDDLGLDGHIKSRDGLITDDDIRVCRQGPCNPHPLPLAAGKFMGHPVLQGRIQAHQSKQLIHPSVVGFPAGDKMMDQQGLPYQILHRLTGIQGTVGILENHLYGLPLWPEFLFLHGQNLLPHQADAARGALDQFEDSSGCRGLPAAGFPYQAQGLPPADGKGNTVQNRQLPHGPVQEPFLHGIAYL